MFVLDGEDEKKKRLAEFDIEGDFSLEEDSLFSSEESLEEELKSQSETIPKDDKDIITELPIGLALEGINGVDISTEVRRSFMDYAMSVIISRAIPDVRDGLKFVHRRILYSMSQLRLTHRAQHKKSARIVGDVLGKYHPHGDASVYDAMVRMAQDFAMRYPLIDGHGNFGSSDGDPAAAMRYTEARLSRLAAQMLEGIDKDTVDFIQNYDNTEQEPLVLPTLFPNLFLQGSSGIAVGIATKIAPHNLGEMIDAAIHLADNPAASIEDLMRYVKGPDFPTGGIIIGSSGIASTYRTGRGSIVLRAKHKIVTNEKTNTSRIVFTEIPYEIKKPKLIEKINQLLSEKKLQGIKDVRDESSREGIQLSIYLAKDVSPELILGHLFKHTDLQIRFNSNMIALVKGEPVLLNLKSYLESYIEHHREVTTRRLNFELKGFLVRIHLLRGLEIAINNIDRVIKIVRGSAGDKEARERLIEEIKVDQKQAETIINLRLGRLAKVHVEQLLEEIKQLETDISRIKAILDSERLLIDEIIAEMRLVKENFVDKRRTKINLKASADFDDDSLIPREDSAIFITAKNYIKRVPLADIKDSRLKTKGGNTRISKYPDDKFVQVLYSHSHSDILAFDKRGWVYKFKAHQIPKSDIRKRGVPLVNINEKLKTINLTTLISISEYIPNSYLITITSRGKIKKTPLESYANINAAGKIALSIPENDYLAKVIIAKEDDPGLCIASSSGKIVTFDSSELRQMGRTAQGVKGISLEEEQEVVGLSTNTSGNLIFALGKNGYGKITSSEKYRRTRRGTKGVKTLKKSKSSNRKHADKSGQVAFVGVIDNQNSEILVLSQQGYITKMHLTDLKISSSTNVVGEKVIDLRDDDNICSVAIINLSKPPQTPLF